MLARREHSGAELRMKLAAKGFPPDLIADALSGLDREGWLSDERFVEVFVRVRRERGFGPLRIRAELRERGVADELIAVHLDESDPLWLQHLERAWTKRRGMRRSMNFAERARHMRFFQSRGFTNEQIRAVIKRGEAGQ